jgi:hypothetical protein
MTDSDLGFRITSLGKLRMKDAWRLELLHSQPQHRLYWITRGQGRVTLRGGLSGQELWVEISDPGRPFPGGCLPAGQAVNLSLPVDALPEGGFGWFLIRSLTSGIDYRRQDGLNRLTLRFAP